MKMCFAVLLIGTMFLFASCANKNTSSSEVETETNFEKVEVSDSEKNVYENLIYAVEDGEIKITRYTAAPTEVVIPTQIKGIPITTNVKLTFQH